MLRRAGWRSEEGYLIRQALRRARGAEWLVDQDWESLLEQLIDEVCEKLGVAEPPVYELVRSAGAPVLARQSCELSIESLDAHKSLSARSTLVAATPFS